MAPHLNQDEVVAASDSKPNLGSDRPRKATTSEVTLPGSTSPDETQPAEAPSPVSTARLFRYADKKDKSLMTTGVVTAILSSLVTPVVIVLFGNVTDAMTKFALNSTADGSADNLNTEMDYFVYGIIAIAAFQQLTSLTFVFCFYYAASRQARRIKQLFFRSALRQDISWYDTKQMGDFTTRVTEDLKKMEDGMGEKIGMCLGFLATFMFGIGLSFYKGWKLTLVISSFIPLMVITGGFMSKLQADCAQREAQAYSDAGAVAEEAIGAVRTVVAFGGQQKESDRYSESMRGASRAMVMRGGVTAVGVGLVWLVQFSAFALAFWYGTKLVLQSREAGDGLYSAGTLTIVFFSILLGAIYMGQAAPHIEALSSAKSAAATVFSVIERESDIDPSGRDGVQPGRVEGLVELKDVHFSYPSRPDTQVLHGVSFVVRPGQTVALVGTSGCGKSTCIQLIQRFYDPSKGEVLLDGRKLSELNVSWLRRQIGVVSQEPVLFGTTIAENIRYGSPDCSMEDIEQAARQANAFDFIQSLPEKFDTLVGQRGAQLSGGQKQRIAIARALVRNPAVFLLDEATSALDLHSEALVQAALDKARRGRTTIVVAHRLSTIRSADVICAVKDGRVVEVGTHDQLMQQDGVYCSLVTSQTGLNIEQDDQEPDGSDGEKLDVDCRTAERADDGAGGTDVVSNGSTDDFKSAPAASKARSRPEEDEAALPAISGWRILSLNRREWPYLLLGVLGAAGMGALMPGYAVVFGAALGNLSVADPDEAMSNAKLYGLLFLAVGAVAFTASFVQIFMFGIAGERMTTRVRKLIFSTLLRQEIGYFDDVRHTVGVLCARLSGDAAALQGATGTRLGNVTQAVITVLLGMALAFYLSWQLALAALPFVPLCGLATYVESRQNSGVATGERTELESGNQIAVEAISNIRTVASLGLEEMLADQYEKRLTSSHRKYIKKAFFRGLVYGGARCVPMLAYAVVFGVSKHMILDKTIPYSHLFMIIESLIYGTELVGAAVAFSPDFNKAFDAAKRVFALLDRKSAIDSSHSSGLKPSSVSGRIALKGVAFRYPSRPEAPVLRDLSLEVSPGQQVALVGASGCGKSTCIQLLERFYDADDGDVTLDGHRVSALDLGWLRSNIGIVSQEPVLFDRTIAENIAYGDNSREVPMEDIIAAARDANVHSFVTSLPAGYETRLGSSSGTQLSGGQKQRVAIARALLRRPAVLLLDEATSALDAQSEKSVQEALDRAASGRTCLVIAHRLSTIRGADRIAVMHRGRVVEQGTHQELLTRRGVYYNLYRTNA